MSDKMTKDEAEEFGEKAQAMMDRITDEFKPQHALIFLAGATAQAIMRSTVSKKEAQATAYRVHRNVMKGLKELVK